VDTTFFLVATIVVVALIFDFTNGFHDAANAIATSVATRALSPRIALVIAAIMNFLGALLGTEVAKTIGGGIVDISPDSGTRGLVIVFGSLLGAIAWNLITWWFGLPSSSSHALIGDLAGAGLGPRFDAGQQEVGRLMMLAEDDLDSPALHRLNISLARQVLERLAHGVAGDPEVVGQGVLRWQEGQERVLAPLDACAQRRVDLLVLRRGHVPPPSRPALIGQPVIG